MPAKSASLLFFPKSRQSRTKAYKDTFSQKSTGFGEVKIGFMFFAGGRLDLSEMVFACVREMHSGVLPEPLCSSYIFVCMALSPAFAVQQERDAA